MARIYYSSKDWADTTERPENTRGIQVIVQHSQKVGWYTESHGDYYLFKNGLWRASDFNGLTTELKKQGIYKPTIGLKHEVYHEGKWVKVKQPGFDAWLDTLDFVLCGETIDNDEFHEIFQHALADADFGRKEGFLPRERKP